MFFSGGVEAFEPFMDSVDRAVALPCRKDKPRDAWPDRLAGLRR